MSGDGDAVPGGYAAMVQRLLQHDDGRADALRALVAAAGRSGDDRTAALDALRAAARGRADGIIPDASVGPALAALATAAHAIAGFGVHPLGRPAFLSPALLDLLRDEARAQLDGSGAGASARRSTQPAGEVLSHVAVSRQLREAVSAAAGRPLTATFDALYEYDPPGSHVRTHLDAAGYEWTCHLLVEHHRADAPGVSVLLAHRPDGTIERHTLHAGEAIVLRGRGTLHAWAPLGADERRTLIAVGFRDAGEGTGQP